MLVVISAAPEAGPQLQEALEAASMAAAFGLDVHIALLGAARRWLDAPLEDYSPESVRDFGVAEIYALDADHPAAQRIDAPAMQQLLSTQHPVLSF